MNKLSHHEGREEHEGKNGLFQRTKEESYFFVTVVRSFEKTGVLRYGSAAAAYSGDRSNPVSRVARSAYRGTMDTPEAAFSFSAGERKIMNHFVVQLPFQNLLSRVALRSPLCYKPTW